MITSSLLLTTVLGATPLSAVIAEPPAAGVPSAGPARKEITVPAKVLDGYVGEYELKPGFRLAVSREAAGLAVQATGQPRFPVFATAPTEFFYKVVDARITFVADASGKVTRLVLHQNGADMPAARISSVVTPPKTRREVAVPASVIDAYVGEYLLAPTFTLAVTRQGAGLVVQATGQPAFPIFAESPTEFFYKVVDAQLTFVKSPAGKVTGVILHQGGADLSGQKVK